MANTVEIITQSLSTNISHPEKTLSERAASALLRFVTDTLPILQVITG